MINTLINDDCFNVFKDITNKSVDLVLLDYHMVRRLVNGMLK